MQVLADVAELLEVPELADGRAPEDQQPLVQAPDVVRVARQGLEADGVAADGRRVVAVQPPDRLLAGGDADGLGALRAGFALGVGGGGGVVAPDVAGADEEDVALVDGGALVG